MFTEQFFSSAERWKARTENIFSAVLFRNRTNLCRNHQVCSKDIWTTISAQIVPCVSAMLAPVLMASRSTHVLILNDMYVEYHSYSFADNKDKKSNMSAFWVQICSKSEQNGNSVIYFVKRLCFREKWVYSACCCVDRKRN